MTSNPDGFIPVKSRKGRRGHGHSALSQEMIRGNATAIPRRRQGSESVDDIKKKVEAARDHLLSSEFFSHFERQVIEGLQKLGPPDSSVDKITCYGLGCFSECVIARYQLGMLLILRSKLFKEVPLGECFDPMFYVEEQDVLKELGFHVLKENEEGKRKVDQLTLFYLPHCSHQLVNNVLFANWEKERLHKCVLICNSFSNMYSTIPSRLLSESLFFIHQVRDFCVELAVENSFEHSDIFNDTAIIVFPKLKLQDKPESFWLDKPVPNYNDCDFVKLNDSNCT